MGFSRLLSMATSPAVRALLLVAAALVLPTSHAAAQDAAGPPTTVAAWMGLETGDAMVFEGPGGERMCVTVGEPRRIGGRLVVPLEGLAWPGFASDSRIFLPLDGALDLLVDWTPGPRPSAVSFLDPDGWKWEGPDWRAADSIVHVTCAPCTDEGTRLVLEKGGGIRSISELSFAGSTSWTRLEGGCAERDETELRIYVEPAPEREP